MKSLAHLAHAMRSMLFGRFGILCLKSQLGASTGATNIDKRGIPADLTDERITTVFAKRHQPHILGL